MRDWFVIYEDYDVSKRYWYGYFGYSREGSFNTTGATRGAGTAYPFGAPEFTPVFSGVCQHIRDILRVTIRNLIDIFISV
jgi:hypothetical protein